MTKKVTMDLIPFEEAYSIVMNASFETDNEVVDFTASAGRVLRVDIKSDIDMPPFNKSTVDGFACRKADLGAELEMVETIRSFAVYLQPSDLHLRSISFSHSRLG